MRLLGAVLAGGQSRRFGSDKAAATVGGKLLIAHVAEALRRECTHVVVTGRAYDGFQFLRDRPVSDLGPLGGLCAALQYGAAMAFDAVLSAPCDVPNLPEGIAAALARAGPAACVADMPVIGLWPCGLAGRLAEHLQARADRSLRGWARVIGARPVRVAGLANINTPLDLAAFAETGLDIAGARR